MADAEWHDLGPIEKLSDTPLRQVKVNRTSIALCYRDGRFTAISGAGADILVAGSAVYGAKDYAAAIRGIRGA